MVIQFYDRQYYIDASFTIQREKSNRHILEPVHTHDFVELIYVYEGKMHHTLDGKAYTLARGDLLFVNYQSEHGFEAEGALEYVNIILKPDFISRSLQGEKNIFSLLTLSTFNEFATTVNQTKHFMHFSETERRQLEALISIMEAEEGKCDRSDFVLQSALNVFLAIVFRKMSFTLTQRFSLDSELLAYIRNNCGEKLTLKHIAEKCAYNPTYFSRVFKAFAGISFVKFLAKCRVDKACVLLRTTDKKIEEIIEDCGFSDRTKFFKLFCGEMGVTPLKYRKNNSVD